MQYQPLREPVGKRVGRFLSLLIILGFIGMGVTAYLRFDTETLALVAGGGMVCGSVVLLLLFALGFYYIKRRTEVMRPPQPHYPAYPMPQFVIQAPPAQPALPNYGGPYEGGWDGGNTGGWGFEPAGRDTGRSWEIIGGEE